jgi:hypothetical protein
VEPISESETNVVDPDPAGSASFCRIRNWNLFLIEKLKICEIVANLLDTINCSITDP